MQKERPLLKDKEIFPDDTVLMHHLGKTFKIWSAFLELLKTEYPEIRLDWKYYNDGKSWLCKASRKSKTICWISVWDQYFKISFFFTDKAHDLISSSSIPETLKHQFTRANPATKLKPVVVDIKERSDLNAVEELIDIRQKLM